MASQKIIHLDTAVPKLQDEALKVAVTLLCSTASAPVEVVEMSRVPVVPPIAPAV